MTALNLVIFLLIAVIAFATPLCVLRLQPKWLLSLVPIYLIIANVFAESFFPLGGVLLSHAIPVYAGIYLITDLLHELHGSREARRAVYIGLLGQLMFVAMMVAVINAPILPDKAAAFSETFAILPRLVLGSFVAYFVSQLLDITVYSKIREATGGKYLFLRNNGSTMVSQLVDTAIFLGIAFYGVPPFADLSDLLLFGLFVWLSKVLVAALDTPFLYLAAKTTRGRTTNGA